MSRSFGETSFTTRPEIDKVPLGDVFESRHHAQRRGLAAAGRPDEDHELTVGDVQVEIVDCLEAVRVDLGHLFEGDRRHQFSFSRIPRELSEARASAKRARKAAPVLGAPCQSADHLTPVALKRYTLGSTRKLDLKRNPL